jgi:outer membrane protein
MKMKSKQVKRLALLIYISGWNCLSAQEELTFQQAVETVLKNNYSIVIARDQSEITKNNTTIGNAGFLPVVTLNGGGNYSNNNTHQDFSAGNSVDRNGATASSVNAGIGLGWTIFDGFKMFATYEKLKILREQGELNLKMQIENTIATTASAYYDVVRQQKLIKATNEAIKLYDERIKISQKKMEIGSASKLDLLQAKADLNAQRAALLKLQINLASLKATLSQLLASPVDKELKVTDTIPLTYSPAYSDLKKTTLSNNNQLLFAQKNIDVANQTLKEFKSFQLPLIGVNANYNFSQTQNQVGLVLLNRNLGFNAGFTASWTLFNGFRTRTQVKNSYLAIHQNEQLYAETKSSVEAALLKAWINYTNSMQALKLEEENITIVQENIAIAMERFRIGSSTSIELITAQKSYEDAMARLIGARYDAKLAETELMRLNGDLVK